MGRSLQIHFLQVNAAIFKSSNYSCIVSGSITCSRNLSILSKLPNLLFITVYPSPFTACDRLWCHLFNLKMKMYCFIWIIVESFNGSFVFLSKIQSRFISVSLNAFCLVGFLSALCHSLLLWLECEASSVLLCFWTFYPQLVVVCGDIGESKVPGGSL